MTISRLSDGRRRSKPTARELMDRVVAGRGLKAEFAKLSDSQAAMLRLLADRATAGGELASRVEKVLSEVNRPRPNAGAFILAGRIRRLLNGDEA
jgi:hypothetical protein